jgi:hypothetical protein
MFLTAGTEKGGDLGKILGGFLTGFYFTVEYSQRIGGDFSLAVPTEDLFCLLGLSLQFLEVRGTTLPAADRIDQDFSIRDIEDFQQVIPHLDDLGIYGRILFPEDFDIQLMKLAVTALLRLVVTEHRSDIIKPQRLRLEIEAVFDDRTDDRRGVFRP